MPTAKLSTVSGRNTLVLDERGRRVVDEAKPFPALPNQGSIGLALAFGGFRLVTALPTNDSGPVQVSPPVVFGNALAYLGDIDGNFVGEHGAQFIHRMVSARWVENTRRLGG